MSKTGANPLPGYEDWPTYLEDADPYRPASQHAAAIAERLGVSSPDGMDYDVQWHESHTVDGVLVTRLSWFTGYGPRTGAYLLKPADTAPGERLPGVLGLHCHSGDKWSGAQRLVDAGKELPTSVKGIRDRSYGARAAANDLAGRGYVVLVHDAFSWGSRRFALSESAGWGQQQLNAQRLLWKQNGVEPTADMVYNAMAGPHENTVSKTASLLGTSYAGAIARDDLIALSILADFDNVDADRLGCFGFSGGACRSLLLAALSERVKTYAVTCGMATYKSLVPEYVDIHSWLLCIPGLSQVMDWPEVSASSHPQHMLVQYATDDRHFPIRGMRAADNRLREIHGTSEAYSGSFWTGDHRFDASMQAEVWQFMEKSL